MKVRDKIIFQNQPDDKTCTSACLAMILGMPVGDVVKDFHPKYINGDTSPSEYMLEKGVTVVRHYTEKNSIYTNKVYLATVPSLTIVAGIHHIVIDTRDIQNLIVLDPQKGRGGNYYVFYQEQDKEGVELKGFVLDFEVIFEEEL